MMNRTTMAIVAVVAAVAVAAPLAWYFWSGQGAGGGGLAGAVEISGYAFSPATLNVEVGDTVTWTNLDPVQHSVVSDSELASPLLSRGESYSHTFARAGTYEYHCGPHPDMTGKIVVV